MKSVLIDDVLHERLKKMSIKSGIKIKIIVEKGIELYLERLKIDERSEG